MRRGYHLDTRPRLDTYGDCRSQRITFFQRRKAAGQANLAEPALDRLELVNRYRQPDWLGEWKAPDCTAFDPTGWAIAAGDSEFHRSVRVLMQVAAFVRGDARPIALTCREHGVPCADPAARLREAFTLGVDRIDMTGDRRTVTATHTPYAGRQYVMIVTTGAGGSAKQIDLSYPIPPLS